ncbi:MAG: M48 family metalloprotease [Thermoflexibacter sp.]|jgi:predicted Zn-dependent protease|nr:M48 family metalloprotease [Thermoflexibacter sp.]
MLRKKHYFILIFLCFYTVYASAQELNSFFFSIEDEIKLGQQVAAEVEKDPKNKILDEKKYPQAYANLRRITNNILNSGQVRYKTQFAWQVKIIHNDSILNAFCAPGGFIYVYTGLIKFLDSEDQFAGVMAHEIAHADRRHATENILQAYGIGMVMQLLLGRNSGNMLAQIVGSLVNLNFSRKHEKEADDYSVIYLCNTPYQADGAAGFFGKLQRTNRGSRTPEFLSTHPNPENRVQNIKNAAVQRKCNLKAMKNANYMAFKRSLPQ